MAAKKGSATADHGKKAVVVNGLVNRSLRAFGLRRLLVLTEVSHHRWP
jgi:hypothetical protein